MQIELAASHYTLINGIEVYFLGYEDGRAVLSLVGGTINDFQEIIVDVGDSLEPLDEWVVVSLKPPARERNNGEVVGSAAGSGVVVRKRD